MNMSLARTCAHAPQPERPAMAVRRTTMRSRTGTKLYAVRDKSGKFKDIQTYKRAHAADLRHKSKAEKEAAPGAPRVEDQKSGERCRQVGQEFGARRDRRSAACGEAGGQAGCRPAAKAKDDEERRH